MKVIYTALFSFLSFEIVNHATAQTYHWNEYPVPITISSVDFKNDTIYAATIGGVYVYTRQGVFIYNFNTLNSPLPSNQIEILRVDHLGRIWIVPISGNLIYILDGINWKTYILPQNTQIRNASFVGFDSKNRLWVAGYSQVSYFDGTAWHDVDLTSVFLNTTYPCIESAALDQNDHLWFDKCDYPSDSLNFYEYADGSIIFHRYNELGTTTKMTFDHENHLCSSSVDQNTVQIIKDQNGILTHFNLNLFSSEVQVLLCDTDNSIWALSAGLVLHIKDYTQTAFHLKSSPYGDWNSMFIDSLGSVWISNRNQFYTLKDSPSVFINMQTFPFAGFTPHADSRGRLWFNDLSHLIEFNGMSIDTDNLGESFNSMTLFKIIEPGDRFLVYSQEGLSVYVNDQWKRYIIPLPPAKGFTYVADGYMNRANDIDVKAVHVEDYSPPVYYYFKDSDEVFREDLLSNYDLMVGVDNNDKFIYSNEYDQVTLLKNDLNYLLWGVTLNGYLVNLSSDPNNAVPVPGWQSGETPVEIYFDQKNNLILTTNKRVLIYHNGGFSSIDSTNSNIQPGMLINASAAVDSAGNLWYGNGYNTYECVQCMETDWTGIAQTPGNPGNTFNIFPAITTGSLTIQYKTDHCRDAIKIMISNLLGQNILQKDLRCSEFQTQLMLPTLTNGVYICSIEENGTPKQSKIFMMER